MTIPDLIALALLALMLLYMSKPHGRVTFTNPPPDSDPPNWGYENDAAQPEKE